VLAESGVLALPVLAEVACDALVAVEDLDRARRGAKVDLLVHELVGHAVKVVLEFDVVVEVDTDPDLPLGELEGFLGQWLEVRLVEFLEEILPGATEILQGTTVELLKQHPHSAIDLVDREEGRVPERGDDPALRYLDGDFDLGLVPGLSGPRGDDAGRVVSGELRIGRVQRGIVAARP
jgi:hypothetical protein